MIKLTKSNYEYNATFVVLFTELSKLIISVCIYLYQKSLHQLIQDLKTNKNIFYLYFIPAGLYCLYNNLAFINLRSYDPTTYYLFLQFRVVLTGILFQVILNRYLTPMQWLSLLILTFGCIIKDFGLSVSASSSLSFYDSLFNYSLLLILFQVFCSCFAGVYNEYLLKYVGSEIDIVIQNIYMYIDSILCNILILTLQGRQDDFIIDSKSLKTIFEPLILILVLNNSFCGLITSYFLKNLNSILKTYASALELVMTAILCWIIFSIPIDIFTLISISIVFLSTYLFFKHSTKSDSHQLTNSSSSEKLNHNSNQIV